MTNTERHALVTELAAALDIPRPVPPFWLKYWPVLLVLVAAVGQWYLINWRFDDHVEREGHPISLKNQTVVNQRLDWIEARGEAFAAHIAKDDIHAGTAAAKSMLQETVHPLKIQMAELAVSQAATRGEIADIKAQISDLARRLGCL